MRLCSSIYGMRRFINVLACKKDACIICSSGSTTFFSTPASIRDWAATSRVFSSVPSFQVTVLNVWLFAQAALLSNNYILSCWRTWTLSPKKYVYILLNYYYITVWTMFRDKVFWVNKTLHHTGFTRRWSGWMAGVQSARPWLLSLGLHIRTPICG